METDLSFPLYVLVKFVAYFAWSYFGLRLLRGPAALNGALGFGFVRLCLGVAFGIGIFFAGGMLHLEVPRHAVLMYLSIYAPVRYVEWSILCALILRRGNAGPIFSRPSGTALDSWRHCCLPLGGPSLDFFERGGSQRLSSRRAVSLLKRLAGPGGWKQSGGCQG